MNAVGYLLVGLDEHSHALAEGAVRQACPGSVTEAFATVEEALKSKTSSEVELLVLAGPNPKDLTRAVEAADATGLRRWAVVVLGNVPAVEGVEVVSAEEWSEPLLTRVFRSAIAQHQLRRANARMAGDLRTIAHRISHDLRTPLNGILSTGEALKETLSEHDPASVTLAKPLFDSVTDLTKLFDRVSLLTKASSQPVSKRPVAMEEVVWAVRQRLERQVLKKNAALILPASWPTVAGVPSWLEVVWWNLLNNALQHGNEAARIELGWSQNGCEFRFWVRDEGKGVRPEMLGSLFQPFHVLHQSNAGNGLGLSIVQRLVELQGGHCGYEPVAPGGSMFFFTLPAGEPGEAPDDSRHADRVTAASPLPPAAPDPDPLRATRA
jgi:signal transduction histidine kinase